ncbi:MAG: mechanosensitive ion channel domain-containing protein [Candidatus Diapherotrites archaeon]
MPEDRLNGAKSLILKIAIGGAILVFLYLYGSLIWDLLWNGFFTNEGSFQSFVPVLLSVLFFIVGTEIFLILTRYVISKYLENRGKKKEIKIILTLYTYLVWGVVGLFLISTIFKDIGALLTSIGLIGFGITFALQKPILNFVGWLTIVITKPFNIGDRIEVQEIRGDVLGIHTMYTTIQGTRLNSHERSEKIITLPNELILTNAIINYSKKGEIYADEVIVSITYGSNWRKASEMLAKVTKSVISKYFAEGVGNAQSDKKSWQEAIGLLQAASKKLRRGVFKESVKEKIDLMKSADSVAEAEIPEPQIQMSLADSSINLSSLYHTDLHSVRVTKHEITKAFYEEVERSKDIEIAYPHMQLVYGDNLRRANPNDIRQKKL